jgi:hypothetical protein
MDCSAHRVVVVVAAAVAVVVVVLANAPKNGRQNLVINFNAVVTRFLCCM